MRSVTVGEASKNLNGLLTTVMNDSEPAIVITESGEEVVLMPLDDYNAWRETHYLLANPANAAHLRRSVDEANTGTFEERNLLEA